MFGSTCSRGFIMEGGTVGKLPSRYSTIMGVDRERLGDVS